MNTRVDKSSPKRLVLEYDSSIGEALRRIRHMRGLRQEDVARSLGYGQATLSKLEAGQRSLKVAELPLFADALGMTRDELSDVLLADIEEQRTRSDAGQ